MRKRRSNIEGLADALNEMGIRTTVIGSTDPKHSFLYRLLRNTEKARRATVRLIDRISRKAKRFTPR